MSRKTEFKGTAASRRRARRANLQSQEVNRPGFPGECFICELRLPDHRF